MFCTIECFHMTSRRPYWCPKTMKRRPCWCPKPVLWELNSFLMQTLSFVPINLHRCWSRESKHSICTWNLHVNERITRFARATGNYENKQRNNNDKNKQSVKAWLTRTSFHCQGKPKNIKKRCYIFRRTFSSGSRQTSFISVPVLRFVSAWYMLVKDVL